MRPVAPGTGLGDLGFGLAVGLAMTAGTAARLIADGHALGPRDRTLLVVVMVGASLGGALASHLQRRLRPPKAPSAAYALALLALVVAVVGGITAAYSAFVLARILDPGDPEFFTGFTLIRAFFLVLGATGMFSLAGLRLMLPHALPIALVGAYVLARRG